MSVGNLKEALIDCLDGTLSPNDNIRKSSEARLKALEVTDTFSLHLLEIIRDNQHFNNGKRQLASILLRQYVDTHWINCIEKFIPPEPTNDVKNTIRLNLPMLLNDPESKIRNSVAAIIASIARWDWPEQWPDLFDMILPLLKEQQYVNGAIRVMTELVKELTESHIYRIAPTLFNEMLRILNHADFYSKDIRVCAIEIFRELVTQMQMSTNAGPDQKVLGETLDPIIQQFMLNFVLILQENNLQLVNYKLKRTVIHTTAIFLRICPKRIIKYLEPILGPVWTILTSSVNDIRKFFNGSGNEDGDNNDDDNNDECGIEYVIFAILEFINLLLEDRTLNNLVKNGLNELVYYVVFYMQLPQERVEAWLANATAFATDEDDENATYTLRVCAQDFLLSALEEFPTETISALGKAVERHLINDPTRNDWRLHEACLAAVCALGTRIVNPLGNTTGGNSARTVGNSPPTPNSPAPETPTEFNLHGFVEAIVIPGLTSGDILLSGRCLVLGANFCTILSPETTLQFVRTAAEHLSTDNRPIIARILAAKAITIFVEQSKENHTIKLALLQVLPNVIEPLTRFAAIQPVEILSGFMDIIIGIIELDENFTATITNDIITLGLACFIKYNDDPVICPAIEEIVTVLCKNLKCYQLVQERFTPTLVSVLNNTNQDLGGPQGVALDILTAIVRASPSPLTTLLMTIAFPSVLGCLQRSEDQTVLQNGGECLRAYLSKTPLQVMEWKDNNSGLTGLGHIVTFAIRLLDPSSSEFSATFVGKLVTALIVKTGDKLGDQLELLLRAVLSKLQSADTLSVIQNLCLVYAHLFNTQLEPSLAFLEGVPGPTGQSALHFVMTEWVNRQSCFYGQFDRKITSIALSKLLQYGITTNDKRLTSIQVKGDPIIDPTNTSSRIITRSQALHKPPQQWTTIPLLVKIFKLLIHELSCCFMDDDDYETDDDDDSEGQGGHGGGDGQGSSGAPGGDNDKENVYVGGDNDYNDDDENGYGFDDPDIINDPVFGINLEDYLTNYIKEFSQCPYYQDFYNHLLQNEIKVLNVYLNKNNNKTPREEPMAANDLHL